MAGAEPGRVLPIDVEAVPGWVQGLRGSGGGGVLEELDGVAVGEVGRGGGEVAGLLGDLHLDRLHHEGLAGEVELEACELPVVAADVGLLEQDGAAFVELAEEAEAEVDVGGEMGVDAGEALLGAIDPDLAGDAAQDVGFEVGRIEARIGCEAEAIALAGGAGDDAFEAIEEGLGEQRHEVVDAGGVALLAPVAVLLELGMGGERVEATELGALGVGRERLAVDGDQAGDVAVPGLDDLLGGVAGDAVALLGFVEEVAEGEVVGVGSARWARARRTRAVGSRAGCFARGQTEGPAEG